MVQWGSGHFLFGDTPNGELRSSQAVFAGDLVVIPEGSVYEYTGYMAMTEINVSPDNTFRDTKLEQ
jgi:hypothetical protein